MTTKATDHFKSALPEKGPQIQLEGVGDTDKARLQAMRDEATPLPASQREPSLCSYATLARKALPYS